MTTLQEAYAQKQDFDSYLKSLGYEQVQTDDSMRWTKYGSDGTEQLGPTQLENMREQFTAASSTQNLISQAGDGRYMAYEPGMTLDSPTSSEYQRLGLMTVRDALKAFDPGFNEANWLPAGSADNPFDSPVYQRSDQYAYGKVAPYTDSDHAQMIALALFAAAGGVAAAGAGAAGAAGAAGVGEAGFGAGLASELGVAGAGMSTAEGLAALGITTAEEAAAAGLTGLAEGLGTEALTIPLSEVEVSLEQQQLDQLLQDIIDEIQPVDSGPLAPPSLPNLPPTPPSVPSDGTTSPAPPPTKFPIDPKLALTGLGTAATVANALGGGDDTGAMDQGIGLQDIVNLEPYGGLAPTGAQLLGEDPPTFSMTPEEWAKSIGATLNPDGTIDWSSVDATDLIKSLGEIDSGPVDPGGMGISDVLAKLLGVPTGGTSGGSTAGTAAKTALGRILDGTATSDDWAKLLGTAGATALGALGANQQADAYKAATDKFLGLGQPYRDRLNESYGSGFDLTKSDPQFKNALDTSANTVLRRLSADRGNPFDSPGAMTEAMNYVTGNTYLPQLNTYRSQLGSFGGLGVNQAGTGAVAGAANSGGVYDALGYGLGQLTNPNTSLADLLKNSGLNLGGRF